MAKVYKIHPAIGVARVGNSPSKFFVGPELLGSPGMDIGTNGAEAAVTKYKSGGKIKRQAARFRIFEYEKVGNKLTLTGEVTDPAVIEWKVDLVNRKAALDHAVGNNHPAQPRNTSVTDRDSLIIRDPRERTIVGKSQSGVPFDQGQFLGQTAYLGELRTDAKGRLLVLGGRGASASVPPGLDLPEFANNDGWHDDVSDGPVTAVITLPGQPPKPVDAPAWVVVAPPDFAPGVGGIVTLYDVAFQAAIEAGFLKAPAKPAFRRHIMPVIQRASDLRWVNNWDKWNSLSRDWVALANPAAASASLRKTVFDVVTNPGLADFEMPAFLSKLLTQWKDGTFDNDLNDPVLAATITPENLDRAGLESCIGANFFPGIEASLTLRRKEMYAEAFRLAPANIHDVFPGCLTEIMAVPWQADFYDCRGRWWPSQRPDIAMLKASQIPGSKVSWAAPVNSHQSMVDNAQSLGFIVPRVANGQAVFVEQERNASFPRP